MIRKIALSSLGLGITLGLSLLVSKPTLACDILGHPEDFSAYSELGYDLMDKEVNLTHCADAINEGPTLSLFNKLEVVEYSS